MSMKHATILYTCREMAGLSRKKLSILSGIHENTICQYENSRTTPDVVRYEKLLETMGYKVVVEKIEDKK